IITNRALQKLFRERAYQHTVSNQGIYVPQGVVVGVARKFNSTVTASELAYRKRSLVMDDWSKEFTEPNSNWEALPWSEKMETDIMDYLNSRKQGTLDWIKVDMDGTGDVDVIGKELGIDFNKPTVALLTNVIWDAQVFYPTN